MHKLARWASTVQLDEKTNAASLLQLVQDNKMAKIGSFGHNALTNQIGTAG